MKLPRRVDTPSANGVRSRSAEARSAASRSAGSMPGRSTRTPGGTSNVGGSGSELQEDRLHAFRVKARKGRLHVGGEVGGVAGAQGRDGEQVLDAQLGPHGSSLSTGVRQVRSGRKMARRA